MFDNLLSLQDVYSTIIKSSPMEILHWNSDPFAVVLSGYLSSLQQLWVLGPKWKKMANMIPKMSKHDMKVWKLTEIGLSLWSRHSPLCQNEFADHEPLKTNDVPDRCVVVKFL